LKVLRGPCNWGLKIARRTQIFKALKYELSIVVRPNFAHTLDQLGKTERLPLGNLQRFLQPGDVVLRRVEGNMPETRLWCELIAASDDSHDGSSGE
jgi:hypothetical protein